LLSALAIVPEHLFARSRDQLYVDIQKKSRAVSKTA
jgi:hypothetical protein